MRADIQKVYDWQKLFGRAGHFVSDQPKLIDKELARSRVAFMKEELLEYLEANNKDLDIAEVLDALCDLQYFLFGMVVIHGLQDYFDAAFNTVHLSNMSKLGEDGQPIFRESDGKVLKGPNYWRPTDKLNTLLGVRYGD